MPYYPTEFPHRVWITMSKSIPSNEALADRPASELKEGACFFANVDTSLTVIEVLPSGDFLVDFVDPEKVLPPEHGQSPSTDPNDIVA